MAYTTIDDPSVYFQTKIYTGNGGSLAVTNDGNSDLQPDWAWFKKRGAAEGHALVDTNRGIARFLASNSTAVEQHQPTTGNTDADDIASFDSDGFTFSGGGGAYNQSSNTYVAWQWKANGGTTSSFNESGNNPGGNKQVNTTAGFGIYNYTGTGAAGNIAHGLGATPTWVLIKDRGNTEHWIVATTQIDGSRDGIYLETTGAKFDLSSANELIFDSTNITMSDDWVDTNGDARTYIMYAFSPIKGYSEFGVYTGNGNAQGPFCYTGFKPAWVMVKNTSDANDQWIMWDNKRSPSNPVDDYLEPSTNASEYANSNWAIVDFLSNGFKIRNADVSFNQDTYKYIYMAFAESPFVSSEGVPTTAR